MKSVKTLLFTKVIPEDMMWAIEERENWARGTWVFFEAKKNSLLDIKAHLTAPAVRELKKELLKDFTEAQSKDIFKAVFGTLLKLNETNTALLSIYAKESMFSRKIRDELDAHVR